ncbi:hypothetical protein ACPPVQ_11800 [Diaminobutyricibacter sp. McL0618]|uniref:hypothetical protein n=1 Tax=Leifsonia sp. McL0618 TaxID=3415677 RepID=UPI003CEF2B62
MSATDLRALLAAHPELATKLGRADPQAVADWWHSLDGPDGGLSDAQTALVVGIPAVIGALNGVGWDARYAASKLNIQVAKAANEKKIAALHQQIDDLASFRGTTLARAELVHQIAGLEARQATYTTMEGRQVLLFDLAGNGRYVEVHGTLTASTRNIGVIVNGTTLNMDTVLGYDKRAANFQKENRDHNDDSLVTVTWMGGDFPDWGTYTRTTELSGMANATGRALAEFVDGVRAVTEARSVIVGHSAGGGIVGAAEKVGLSADAVIQVSSAGAGPDVHSVQDYKNPQTPRYTLTAPDDPITPFQGLFWGTGPFGANTEDLEGVTVLDSGPTPLAGLPVNPWAHDAVFDAGTQAWKNIYYVMVGESPQTGTWLAPGPFGERPTQVY